MRFPGGGSVWTVAIAAAATMAAVAAPAVAAPRSFPATGFNGVELKGVGDVTVTTGRGFSVSADGDPRLVERMTADVVGGRLRIGLRPNTVVPHGTVGLRVAVTMPRIASAALSGAGSITVDHAAGRDFAADVGGAGTVRVADVKVGHAALAVGGSGHLIVAGTADAADLRLSGVGSIDADRLATRGLTVALGGKGEVRARADGPATVSLSGLGSVAIAGHPRCTISKSGLGSVRCAA